VMLLLDPLDHHSDLDPWHWGGEESRYTGTVTSSCKIRKLFVMLLLDPLAHHSDLITCPWGGEPIYRY
jgi:hypothetical protein